LLSTSQRIARNEVTSNPLCPTNSPPATAIIWPHHKSLSRGRGTYFLNILWLLIFNSRRIQGFSLVKHPLEYHTTREKCNYTTIRNCSIAPSHKEYMNDIT
jgi:hypothetical protein